jgi:hypothetical protein
VSSDYTLCGSSAADRATNGPGRPDRADLPTGLPWPTSHFRPACPATGCATRDMRSSRTRPPTADRGHATRESGRTSARRRNTRATSSRPCPRMPGAETRSTTAQPTASSARRETGVPAAITCTCRRRRPRQRRPSGCPSAWGANAGSTKRQEQPTLLRPPNAVQEQRNTPPTSNAGRHTETGSMRQFQTVKRIRGGISRLMADGWRIRHFHEIRPCSIPGCDPD